MLQTVLTNLARTVFQVAAFGILLLLFACASHATRLNFESLTVADGLPNSTIWAIEQDNTGYIWLATSKGLSRYNGYDVENFFHSKSDTKSVSSDYLTTIHVDQQNQIWAGTFDGGLNRFDEGQFTHYQIEADDPASLGSNKVTSLTSNQSGLWVATDRGVSFKRHNAEAFVRFDLSAIDSNPKNNIVNRLFSMSDGSILAGTNGGLFYFDKASTQPRKLDINFPDTNLRVRSLLEVGNQLYIGTNENLYIYEMASKKLSKIDPMFRDSVVLSVLERDSNIWVGSFRKGIIRITADGDLINYAPSDQQTETPRISLLIDRHDNLWSGSFDSGISRAYLNAERFSRFDQALFAPECETGGDIRSVFEAPNGDLWFSSNQKYIHYDQQLKSCSALTAPLIKRRSGFYFRVHQTLLDSNGEHWVATTLGLFKLSEDKSEFISVSFDSSYPLTHSLLEYETNKLIIGTSQGSYTLNTETGEATKLKSSPNVTGDISRAKVTAPYNVNGSVWLATNSGLAKLEAEKVIPWLHQESQGLLKEHVYALSFADTHFFAALGDSAIYKFNYAGQLQKKYKLSDDNNPVYPWNILADKENQQLWVSSSNGLFQIDLRSGESKRYLRKDGLSGNVFVQGAAHQTDFGKFYFGGPNGFIAFYPDEIISDQLQPKVVINRFTRLNSQVVPRIDYDGLSIIKPIEYLSELELTHKDYVVGFEFAALHHADSSRNQYAYKLEGLHDNWQYTDASHRSITFTNLDAGDYTLNVKASNKDDIWSSASNNAVLKIRVKPAPWLSWWALLLYGLAAMLSLWWYIRFRTSSAIQHAQKLELEVSERTKEINQQKTIIEGLLKRKDELFANISHEFRTPLTLILGPLEKELASIDTPKDPKRFEMMRRNTGRLLHMVEQILMLTELQNERPEERFSQSVVSTIDAIIASFQPLAEQREIALNIVAPEDCNVLVSRDALEIIVGNLISNAIKYTPKGGCVDVSVMRRMKLVDISVSDTGTGISQSDHKSIFERFVRLDNSSDVNGTGIGLSVVKELVEAHLGEINVENNNPVGTVFTIHLPITNQLAFTSSTLTNAVTHLTHLDASDTTSNSLSTNGQSENTDQGDAILIIEDNLDMQAYIESVLEQNYHCVCASDGEVGINIAIEQVPDLIVCDLMMPGIDGFEVASKLRADPQTCHIPIVMLTARGDKETRIKGWNENIDEYMTKPFDETELNSRVANILSIRNILRRQLGNQLQGDQLKDIPAITEQDQAFLDKLKRIADTNYTDASFTRSIMASKMAISERQLQRKLKALVDLNPMDYLREHRLREATELLMQGKQITRVAYDCGFSSPSHFTRCFKAKFSITPKQYQLKKTSSERI